MPDHHDIPRGERAAHPPGYVQATDPGAVGAFKPWWVVDDTTTPTTIVDVRIRNAANSAWISLVTGIVVSAPVSSVFGRAGAVVAVEGDYSLDLLSDVVITTPGSGHYLRHNGSSFVNAEIPLTDLGSGTPDNTRFLRGDGTWAMVTGATIADGDYDDVTVSGTGTAMTINAGAVGFSKITDIATDRLLGRVSASSGEIEEIVWSDFCQGLVNLADAAAFRTAISAAAATHTHAQADVTDLVTDLGALDTRLDTAESDITTLEGRADALEALIPAPVDTVSTTTHTLATADVGKYIRYTNAAGCQITVPDNSDDPIPVNSEFHGIGTLNQLEFIEDTSVTINTPETLFTAKAFSVFTIKKVATDEWDLFGDLELV